LQGSYTALGYIDECFDKNIIPEVHHKISSSLKNKGIYWGTTNCLIKYLAQISLKPSAVKHQTYRQLIRGLYRVDTKVFDESHTPDEL
jgi:hypothetical protein